MSIDYSRYLKVCNDALEREDLFMGFKSNPDYRVVLEHVSTEQGKEYLDVISPHNSRLISLLELFATNDNIGNPARARYKINNKVIEISPTTLRYVKVLNDLMLIFGSLDGMDIVEIGVGYGGQCKIISDLFKFKSYTLVDLPEVLSLSDKFLDKMGVENIVLRQPHDAAETRYDLCISNYAFTEIDRLYQVFYRDNIIRHSDRGYITCNFIGRPDGLSKQEILNLKENSWELEEKPLTYPNNFIYVWDLIHR